MVRKFFPHDKNYLLEDAQLRLRDRLLSYLIDQAVSTYQRVNNPLGLNDTFSERIANYMPSRLDALYPFYEMISGVYRFKYGDNQLSILWDGRDHSEQYGEDWAFTFSEWMIRLCRDMQFAQAVLDLTVFLPNNQSVQLVSSRMNAVILDRFEVKMHKEKGIMRVA